MLSHARKGAKLIVSIDIFLLICALNNARTMPTRGSSSAKDVSM